MRQRILKNGGVPEVVGPFLGRAAATVKAMADQALPFDEALLGDLALEHQLLDRARYIKARASDALQRKVSDELANMTLPNTAHPPLRAPEPES